MYRPKKGLKLGVPIAIRELTVANDRSSMIVVRIGKPRRDKVDWICPFQISGLKGHNGVYSAFGIDAVQALQLAFQGVRNVLDSSKKKLAWLGKEAGDIGFPKPISTPYGLRYTRRLERIVESHSEKFGREFASRNRGKR